MASQKHSFLWAAAAVVTAVTLYSSYRRKTKPTLFIKKSLPWGYNAMTVPPFGIYIAESQLENKKLLQHELVHWQQYQREGLLRYYVCYGCEMMKYGYDGSPMEQEARTKSGESQYCSENYTECVRNGNAYTVCDPDFRK